VKGENKMAQLFFAPQVPYAGLWDGSWNFSRSICAGNYEFGGKVTGDFVPAHITLRRNGKEVTVFGYQAVTEVTILGWCTSIVGQSVSRGVYSTIVPPGDVWVGGRSLRKLWIGAEEYEYDVVNVCRIDQNRKGKTKCGQK